MNFEIDKKQVFASTAGKDFDQAKQTVFLLHGSGLSHIVWSLTEQFLSNKDLNILSLDLPGHGNNPDKPLDTIGKISNYIFNFLDKNSIKKCSIVGHSMGSLIALEMASSQPKRINAISMIGTAFPMQVNEALLESAKENPEIAINILTFMGYSYSSRLGGNKTPGMWLSLIHI